MDEIREAAFLRQALELAAISRITKHITDHQLQLVSRNLRVQEFAAKDRDHTQFYQLDTEFHEMILSFTGFRRIAGLAQSSWLHTLQQWPAAPLAITPCMFSQTLSKKRAQWKSCNLWPSHRITRCSVHNVLLEPVAYTALL